eukprot:m.392675 g.392675  ORF g.392675 m.392675 type:complete len:672 (+) comp21081_c0_seq1:174-2189(+)
MASINASGETVIRFDPEITTETNTDNETVLKRSVSYQQAQPPRKSADTNRRQTHASVLGEEQFTLNWNDVGYHVEVKRRNPETKKKEKVSKTVLSGVTGCLKPGEFMCVLGTSGSGKTTMLNVLSGRHLNGDVTGRILCNDKKRQRSFRRKTAYVEQDDLMFAHLTVTETLVYTALLRLPRSMSRKEKIGRANEVIDQLGLADCRDTRIGNAMRRGVSGGERKRASIGIELITNPRILFLDEPTSGLDSYTAYHIMETIKTLTQHGRSVICSVHQPREKIFHLFDKIMLLSKGTTCYYGPQTGVRDFFTAAGHPCPPQENLADFLLDTCTIDVRNKEIMQSSVARVEALQHYYTQTTYAADTDRESKQFLACAEDVASHDQPVDHDSWNLTWAGEFSILISRAWKNVTREPRTTIIAFMQSFIMALVVGLIFWDIQDDQAGISNLKGLMFFIVLNNSFMALTGCIHLFHMEKQVFNRERNSGTYRVSAYFMAKTLSDLPTTMAPVVFHITILYFMVGMTDTAEAFFKTILIMLSTVICAQSFGLLISASTPTLQAAQILAPTVTIILMLFGGFYVQVDSLPDWLKWVEIFSFMQYSYGALFITQFEDRTFSCSKDTFCLATGAEVIEANGFDSADKGYWKDLGKVLALAVGFRILAYVSLRFAYRQRLKLD